MRLKFIDVSMTLSTGMAGYPGDPKLVLKTKREGGVALTRISMGAHTGTHVDAPAHFIPGGKTLQEMGLERLNGACRVCDLTGVEDRITPRHLAQFRIRSGDIVLLKTRNSRILHLPFTREYVSLTQEAALFLAERGVSAVGVDYLSVDPWGEDTNHKILLKSGIPIIEGLDLTLALNGKYSLTCMPLRLLGTEAAPARCVLSK